MPKGKKLEVVERVMVNSTKHPNEKYEMYIDIWDLNGPLYKIRQKLNDLEKKAKEINPEYTEISIDIQDYGDGYDLRIVGKRPETDKEMEKRLAKRRTERNRKREEKEKRRAREKQEAKELLARYPEIMEEMKDEVTTGQGKD